MVNGCSRISKTRFISRRHPRTNKQLPCTTDFHSFSSRSARSLGEHVRGRKTWFPEGFLGAIYSLLREIRGRFLATRAFPLSRTPQRKPRAFFGSPKECAGSHAHFWALQKYALAADALLRTLQKSRVATPAQFPALQTCAAAPTRSFSLSKGAMWPPHPHFWKLQTGAF